jgi:hypothetical protein
MARTGVDELATVTAADDFLADDARNTNGLRFAALEASQGLFSFYADPGYGGQSEYLIEASPPQPLTYRNATPVVQSAAALLHLPTIRFATAQRIELSGLVDLVVGNG